MDCRIKGQSLLARKLPFLLETAFGSRSRQAIKKRKNFVPQGSRVKYLSTSDNDSSNRVERRQCSNDQGDAPDSRRASEGVQGRAEGRREASGLAWRRSRTCRSRRLQAGGWGLPVSDQPSACASSETSRYSSAAHERAKVLNRHPGGWRTAANGQEPGVVT